MQSVLFTIKAKKEINKHLIERKCENVIISGPPFTLFALGLLLKRKPGLNIILDYRDPWHIWKKGNYLSRFIEKVLVSKASLLLFTNKALMKRTIDFFKLKNPNTLVIENGYDKESWANINYVARREKTLTINYVGSINISEHKSRYRDTKNFFIALKLLINEGYDINVNFIGLSNVNNEVVESYVENMGSTVSFTGKVSPEASLTAMQAADILLLIHNPPDDSGKYLVNGKFYDYAAAKRPILYIGKPTDLHWIEINNNKMGITCIDNVNEILKALKYIFQEWSHKNMSHYACEDNILETYARQYQNQKIIDYFESK